jgi:hypothetical protein
MADHAAGRLPSAAGMICCANRVPERGRRDGGFAGRLRRSAGLEKKDLRRLRWREERVVVNSHPIHCITYDELYEELSQRLTKYVAAAPGA